MKREYFNQIKAGKKPDEFRLLNDYWTKRLVGKHYDTVTITDGYPRRDETDRMMTFPYQGFTIVQLKHKHFGTDEVTVFAIHLYEKKEK